MVPVHGTCCVFKVFCTFQQQEKEGDKSKKKRFVSLALNAWTNVISNFCFQFIEYSFLLNNNNSYLQLRPFVMHAASSLSIDLIGREGILNYNINFKVMTRKDY